MDEEQKTVNQTAEVNSVPESSAGEPKAAEVVKSEAEGSATSEAAVEQPKKATGAEKRIHELVDERDSARQEAESLRQKVSELTSGWEYQSQAAPEFQAPRQNEPATGENSGEERTLTDQELDRRIAQKAATIAQLTIEREKTVSRINSEADAAVRAYPQLDPKSDKYDPDLNRVITEAVWLKVKSDPSQSVTKLVDTYMKPYLKSVEAAVEQKKGEIAEQVVSSALRPSAPAPTAEKSVEDMSIEEIEAKFGKVY